MREVRVATSVLLSAAFLGLAAGCQDSVPSATDDSRQPTVPPSSVVDAYGWAVSHRDEAAYFATMTDDVEIVNDSGACVDWLTDGYWDGSAGQVCGDPIVDAEFPVVDERQLPDNEVELTVVVALRRAEGVGAFSYLRVAFTVPPWDGQYRIRRVRFLPLFAAGT